MKLYHKNGDRVYINDIDFNSKNTFDHWGNLIDSDTLIDYIMSNHTNDPDLTFHNVEYQTYDYVIQTHDHIVFEKNNYESYFDHYESYFDHNAYFNQNLIDPRTHEVYKEIKEKIREKKKDMGSGNQSSEEILQQALEQAKNTIREQNDMLEQLLSQPTVQGYVVSIRKDRAVISIPGIGLRELINKQDNDPFIKDLAPGNMVRLVTEPVLALIDKIDFASGSDIPGEIILVTKEGKDGKCEVDMNGSSKIVHYDINVKNFKHPEVGDRIVVDGDGHVALRNLGPDENKFSFQGVTGVDWNDIGGLATAKAAMKEAVELPIKHAALYQKYGKKAIKGVMLYGPPGCGKTMLAKAAASSIAELHGKSATETGFIYVKGPELLDKYVGNTEAQIRGLFARARKHQLKHGYPAVIFIDEADALLGKRGDRPNMGMEATVVPQFLSEMDGLDDSGAMVLLATNRPDTLDPAVTRDGRIDRKVRVTRPDKVGAEEIFKLYLKKTLLAEDNMDDMATAAASDLYSPNYKLYNLVEKNGKIHSLVLSDLVNGAMIAAVVDKATTLALLRDIESHGDSKPGITIADMLIAIESLLVENMSLNHDSELQEFSEMNKLHIASIEKTDMMRGV